MIDFAACPLTGIATPTFVHDLCAYGYVACPLTGIATPTGMYPCSVFVPPHACPLTGIATPTGGRRR